MTKVTPLVSEALTVAEVERAIDLMVSVGWKRSYLERRRSHARDIARAIKADRSALLRDVEALKEATRWIPVSERLPDGYQWVLVYSDTGDVGDFPFDIGLIIGTEWKCLGWNYPVTHWMPLPSPPSTPVTP